MSLLLALTMMVTPVVSEPATMRPDVLEARVWLRKQMPRRQFRCLHRLWSAESGWRVRARGPLTQWGRAYGIPQALPGRKMRSVKKDWRTNAMTQVMWGRRYIRGRHGKPCGALYFQQRNGWY